MPILEFASLPRAACLKEVFGVGKIRHLSINADICPIVPTTKMHTPYLGGATLVGPLVSCLSFICSPAAVIRIVAFVVIDSIKAMFRSRLFAHVLKEIPRRLNPPIADGNPSAPVGRVLVASLAIAAPHHGIPSIIKRVHGCLVATFSSSIGTMLNTHIVTSYNGVVRGLPVGAGSSCNYNMRTA